MVGKGSVNHNSRKFHAANTDPERSHLNKEYINEDIRTVYHELFDEAVDRYNAKQPGRTGVLPTTTKRYALASRKSRSMS